MPTKLIIWKQGSALPHLGKKIISFDHQINAGPADDRIKIAGFDVQADLEGNFVSDSYSDDELDAIHTFGISRYVLDIYENALNRPILWSWETEKRAEPLSVFIRNNDINARYLKDAKCIQLDYYGPYENWTYYCRSVDIIAHETGHAILDGIKPLWEKANSETRGMAEAFCDLAAMFVVSSQHDLCGEIIKETKGNLRNESILSQFGVGYGSDDSKLSPIRSAINKTRYSQDLHFTYDFAEVLVGCLYDLLFQMTEEHTQNQLITTNGLYETAQKWQLAIIRTFDVCNPQMSSLSEFQYRLIEFLPTETELINKLFVERNIPEFSSS